MYNKRRWGWVLPVGFLHQRKDINPCEHGKYIVRLVDRIIVNVDGVHWVKL